MTTIVRCEPGVPAEPNVPLSIKARQQAMWASGDFAVIGTTLQIVGELLCEAVDVCGGEHVLDVAAGNGNATLAAARRFATVTSTDYVPALLERGRIRAEADGLDVTFQVADAEVLPFRAGRFDAVLSTFGVMFAPDHRQSARELLRVCRPGGRIGLASWTPTGFIGDLFRATAAHVPPLPGVASPLLWGTAPHLEQLFSGARAMTHTRRQFAFRYKSAAQLMSQSLSITTFRYVPEDLRAGVGTEPGEQVIDRLNRALLDCLQREGETFVSNAVLDGRYVLRACIVNFHTDSGDVQALPEIVVRRGRALRAELDRAVIA